MDRKFDPESGQVFTEYAISAQHASPLRWLLQTRHDAKKLRTHDDKRTGILSLREICMRLLLQHASNLEAETLQNVPWEFAKKIWDRIWEERVDNVTVWKAFAIAFGKDFSSSYGRYKAPVLSHHQILSVLPYVSELHCAWLTVLSIHGVQLTQCHWTEIGRMPNLAALFVEGDDYCLDNRTVRAWAIGVQEGGAFPELRVLATGRSCVAIDSSCFDHLAEFPKLEKVRLAFRLRNDQICSSGWRKLKQTGVESRMGMNDALFAIHDDAIRTKPILALSTSSSQRPQLLPRRLYWYERFKEKERKSQQHGNSLQGGSDSGIKQHKIRVGRKRSLHSMFGAF